MKIVYCFVLILALPVCRLSAADAAKPEAVKAAAQPSVSTGTATPAPAAHKKAAKHKAEAAPRQDKPAAAQAVSTAAVKAAPAAQKPAVKAPVEEEGEGAVMIDSKSDEDRSGRFRDNEPAPEADDTNVPGGMPAAYGQLKGALTDGGRSLLVFEGEDGEITFVQVFIGKNAVSWKLISSIRRGAAATAE